MAKAIWPYANKQILDVLLDSIKVAKCPPDCHAVTHGELQASVEIENIIQEEAKRLAIDFAHWTQIQNCNFVISGYNEERMWEYKGKHFNSEDVFSLYINSQILKY